MGFKRSEKRMKQIEVQLREGMSARGISGAVADRIVLSIGSFALYGFPESHAASFALIAYASAYLKAHYPAAFYTALLNNQPMGFYHPATLVKDAQRRGGALCAIDVQESDWNCTVGADGTIRLGLRFVAGLRAEAGYAIAARAGTTAPRPANAAPGHARILAARVPAWRRRVRRRCAARSAAATTRRCSKSLAAAPSPHCAWPSRCRNMARPSPQPLAPSPGPRRAWCARWVESLFCNVCSHQWTEGAVGRRFRSIDDLIRQTGLRRDEVTVLAEIGALNALGHDRRSALWQVERVVRPAGELFAGEDMSEESEQAGTGLAPNSRARSPQ